MKNILKLTTIILLLSLTGCGKKSSEPSKIGQDTNTSKVDVSEDPIAKPSVQKNTNDDIKKISQVVLPTNYIRVSDSSKIVPERGTPFKDFETAKTYKVTSLSQKDLQDTINLASSAGGGIVLAYNGTVKTTDSILMKSGVKLIGSSNSKIEYVGNNSDGVVRFKNVQNATIEKMEIDGGGINANTAGIAVVYGGNRNIKISDNDVHDTGRNGISLYGNAPEDIKNVEISRNKVSYCGVGYYKNTDQFNSFNSQNKSGFHGIETRFTTDVLVASNDISYTDMGAEMTTQTIRGEFIGNKIYHTGWGMKLVAIEDAIVRYNDFSGIIGNDDAVFYSDVYDDQPYSRSSTAWIEYNAFFGAKNGHKSVRLSDLGIVYFRFNDTPDGVDINVVELIDK
jgi:hypothetical protein